MAPIPFLSSVPAENTKTLPAASPGAGQQPSSLWLAAFSTFSVTVTCYVWDSHSESRPDSRAASGADFLAPFLAGAFLPNQKFHVVLLLPKIFLTSFLSLFWGKKEKKRKGREGKGMERERKRNRGREGGRKEGKKGGREGGKEREKKKPLSFIAQGKHCHLPGRSLSTSSRAGMK